MWPKREEFEVQSLYVMGLVISSKLIFLTIRYLCKPKGNNINKKNISRSYTYTHTKEKIRWWQF